MFSAPAAPGLVTPPAGRTTGNSLALVAQAGEGFPRGDEGEILIEW
ncbi:MAG: hypothetical protein KF718_30120 [Polyangiaceae bacterium]|nr:hypothetical protein [Polyangiaceae bacterium]